MPRLLLDICRHIASLLLRGWRVLKMQGQLYEKLLSCKPFESREPGSETIRLSRSLEFLGELLRYEVPDGRAPLLGQDHGDRCADPPSLMIVGGYEGGLVGPGTPSGTTG